jgi:glyceraldehyde 3-phosphate dehydrogenase
MSLKIAINGFGRIGRRIFRELIHNANIEVVAINDLTNPETIVHLLKYDSVHGTLNEKIELKDNIITVGKQNSKIFAEKDPARLPWSTLKVDYVMECTGIFTEKDKAKAHLDAGAKRVIISAPSKDADLTMVMGINHETFDPTKHFIISNGSCTTNCLAPVAKVLNDNFKILKGLMTTVHSYTNDQNVLDLSHRDLRRARAAALSMIPTTTGAAKAIGLVLPELKGKMDGFAVRVPTPNVSMVDLTVLLEKSTSKDEINQKLKEASESSLKGILGYQTEELVSSDFNGSTLSSIVDSKLTNVIDGNFAKVIAWYDNETGFSVRMIDLALTMYKKERN